MHTPEWTVDWSQEIKTAGTRGMHFSEPEKQELAEHIRVTQSVLIVPGSQLGVEGFLRIWIGGKPEFLTEGLRRIKLGTVHSIPNFRASDGCEIALRN